MFRLELDGISKRYPGVTANDGVSLKLRPGEIHAVLGENGAGKSTLMKIIYGAVTPDAGELRWNGTRVRLDSPREARALGIAMVFQHFSLFESLTVAENVWLGQERGPSLRETSRRIVSLGEEYALPLDPARPVHTLGVGERQRVGSFPIWKGPIADQSGKNRLEPGSVADDAFLVKIDFYVKGVEGQLPSGK